MPLRLVSWRLRRLRRLLLLLLLVVLVLLRQQFGSPLSSCPSTTDVNTGANICNNTILGRGRLNPDCPPSSNGDTASDAVGHVGPVCGGDGVSSRTVYVVTATFPRPEQEAELLRLSQTLQHAAPCVLWVLVEDTGRRTAAVVQLLRRTPLRHVHLLGEMPQELRTQRHWGRVPRGVSNRNAGLAWIRQHAGHGVVYFADDDNTYDVRLFPELLRTQRVSVFPVGLVSRQGVSSPVVRHGRVVGFFDGWIGGRRFPLDMAGFAVSTDWLRQNPDARMPYKAGYVEDGFLQSLHVTMDDLEPLANDCSEILVWHTQTQRVQPFTRPNLTELGDTNIVHLTRHLFSPR